MRPMQADAVEKKEEGFNVVALRIAPDDLHVLPCCLR